MLPFSRKARWSLDSLTPPWGEMVSIYDHIRAAPDRQSLPDEPLLRKKYKFGWVGGALDGVFGRHTARGESTKKVFESVEALRRLLQEANKETLTNLYDLIVRDSILSFIDEVLEELNKSKLSVDSGRLLETQNSEIRSWMLREGFRNEVMDEYLACICARAGRLHEALQQQVVDEALLEGAADMLRALLPGRGPAEGIDDYTQGADSCESYINLVWARRGLGLKHFLTVAEMRRFLSAPEGWDKRDKLGWTESRRRTLLALCDDVFAREEWRAQVAEELASVDEQAFYVADTAAKELSIDTWDV